MYGDRKIQWRAGKRKTLEEGLLTPPMGEIGFELVPKTSF